MAGWCSAQLEFAVGGDLAGEETRSSHPGCAAVWAVILGLLALLDDEKVRRVLPVFGGWWTGWSSATIARYVYPPPSDSRVVRKGLPLEASQDGRSVGLGRDHPYVGRSRLGGEQLGPMAHQVREDQDSLLVDQTSLSQGVRWHFGRRSHRART